MEIFIAAGKSLYITGAKSNNVSKNILEEYNGLYTQQVYSPNIKLARTTKN